MTDAFVDLTYRGLSLGRGVKLSDVRPTTGYVELPAPMPVGTQIAIAVGEGASMDATVVEIREQVAGSDKPPGMLVRPRLDSEAIKKWWGEHVSLPEEAKAPAAPEVKSAEPVIVVSKRMTNPGMGVPEIVDDGHDTGVMDAVDPAAIEPTTIQPPVDVAAAEATQAQAPLVDDGKQTTAMDAVDLEALGLAAPTSADSGPLARADSEGGDDDDKRPESKGSGAAKKRKKKR